MGSITLFVLAFSVAASGREEVHATPIQKVIELMTNMVDKGKAEKHEEQMQFAAYKQFCESTTAEKGRAIKEATEAIDKLAADIKDYDATAATRAKEITKLDADISTWETNLKQATEVRESEAADYATTYQDYTESI